MSDQPRHVRVRDINDACREHFLNCTVTVSLAVQALSTEQIDQLLAAVRDFEQFDTADDSHDEHAFGVIELFGQTWFWKFAYYDQAMTMLSDDPSDVRKTRRVLTIMAASEY
jgi:hypothetical protein